MRCVPKPDYLFKIPPFASFSLDARRSPPCSDLPKSHSNMIVTSCLIPILVLAFYLWTANLVLGINVDAPVNALKSKANRLTKPKKGSGTASEEPKEKLLEEPIA